MTSIHIDACVLWAEDLERTAAFYRAVGVPLEDELHEEGPRHLACELGPVHFAIYASTDGRGEAPNRSVSGGMQVGLQLEDLDTVHSALRAIGADVLIAPEDVPWGRRMVVRDPDGRPLELNQKK